MAGIRIWTIGHSTRPLDELLALLAQYGIRSIADVRRFPGSRRNPQYGAAALQVSLARCDIEYHGLPLLGGRRRPVPNSPNTVWRNTSFRGYADYMETEAFSEGLAQLLELARQASTTLMCAEAMWWRCHRALIADALRVRGFEVVHILDECHAVAHPWTAPARIVDGRLTYGAGENVDSRGETAAGNDAR